jgi:mono/diheme cytochrome c family protein
MKRSVLSQFVLGVAMATILPVIAAEQGNAEAGRELVNRSCVTCHAPSGVSRASDTAPPLSFLARDNKYRAAFVRGWLMNPHPPMPGIPLSRQQISDIVAYLQTLPVASGDAAQGKRFAESECVTCHGVDRNQASRNRAAPSFTDIAGSPGLTATAIRVWLQSPHATMPNIKLSDEDKDNVIAYLLSLKSA